MIERQTPPDAAIGSGTADNDGKALAGLEAFAQLYGHAQQCARGCRIGRNQVFASVCCEEGTRLALAYRVLAPYCCRDANPRVAQALRRAVEDFYF